MESKSGHGLFKDAFRRILNSRWSPEPIQWSCMWEYSRRTSRDWEYTSSVQTYWHTTKKNNNHKTNYKNISGQKIWSIHVEDIELALFGAECTGGFSVACLLETAVKGWLRRNPTENGQLGALLKCKASLMNRNHTVSAAFHVLIIWSVSLLYIGRSPAAPPCLLDCSNYEIKTLTWLFAKRLLSVLMVQMWQCTTGWFICLWKRPCVFWICRTGTYNGKTPIMV